MNLYNLTSDMYQVQELINEYLEGGSDEELLLAHNLIQAKEIIAKEIENKTSNIMYVFKNMDAEIDILAAEIRRLQDKKAQAEKRKENLKKLVMESMELLETKNLKTPIGNISVRNNPVKLELEEDFKEEDYIEEVVTYKVDKKELLKDLKNGKEVAGAKLVNGGTSLVIR